MSEIKIKYTTDSRSFIEIWAALPEIGRSMLVKSLIEKNISRLTIYKWIQGGGASMRTIPQLRTTLRRLFHIQTSPYTLFPSRPLRMVLAERYKERMKSKSLMANQWDGKVNWKTTQDEE